MRKNVVQIDASRRVDQSTEQFRHLSFKIARFANSNLSRIEFLKRVLIRLHGITGSKKIELYLTHFDEHDIFEIASYGAKHFSIKSKPISPCNAKKSSAGFGSAIGLESLCTCIMYGQFDSGISFITEKGSLFVDDVRKMPLLQTDYEFDDGEIESLILIPIVNGNERGGIVKFINAEKEYCGGPLVGTFENFIQSLGISLFNQRTHAALRERVKELTCMYGIAQAAGTGSTIDEVIQAAVKLLPPALQYPKISYGKIVFDGRVYSTPGLEDVRYKLSTDLVIKGEKRGVVEVSYSKPTEEIDEGPFLKEERKLIDNVGKSLALIIEEKQAEEDQRRLLEQIRHADRLATIGQLSAGVAHELNEPLGNILGYAQLINNATELPDQVKRDVKNIIKASLHAREIVKKLLIFSRQIPTKRIKASLNQIVEEGLYFLESRCVKEGVKVIRILDRNLPDVTIDPAQITQVLVNLVVNAIQAMPSGGTLKVITRMRKGSVCLVVEDTGQGMSEDVIKQIFLPFFTTKEVGQGTGLGLAVVHGIVTSHGGSIRLDSKPCVGTRFEIELPADGSYRDGSYLKGNQ